MTRYTLDPTTRRPPGGNVVIGGSPLRLFRLTDAGGAVFERLAAGEDVPDSRLTERLLDSGAVHPDHERGPFTASDITVVMPALDATAEVLNRLVEACPGVHAIVVVDDGSVTSAPSVSGATVLRLRSNAGPAVARNAGLGAVTTPLVAFVDTDVRLSPGWLDPLLAHFADERVGLVAPRVASEQGEGAIAHYEETHSPLDLGPEPARVAPGSRVSYVPAAVMLARRAALREVDGFDRSMRSGEDVDLVWRLVEHGWRVRYEPASVAHHAPRADLAALIRQRMAYGSSAAPLARKHPGALTPVRTSGWSAAVWGLALTGAPVSAAVAAAGTSVALVPKLRGLPAMESVRLAATGHLYAGGQLAAAARRVWWPLLLAASLVSKRARWAIVAATVPALARGGVLRVVDDAAYGLGVWRGVLEHGEISPLVPSFVNWPTPRDREEAGDAPADPS